MKSNQMLRKPASIMLYLASGAMFLLKWFNLHVVDDDYWYLIDRLDDFGISFRSRFSLLDVCGAIEDLRNIEGWLELKAYVPQIERIDTAGTIILLVYILLCCALLAAVTGVLCGKRSWGIGMPVIAAAALALAFIADNSMEEILKMTDMLEPADTLTLAVYPYLAVVFAAAGFMAAPGKCVPAAHISGVLTAMGGNCAGAEYPMADGETLVLGRDPSSCSIVLEDSNISRQHCTVRYSAAEGKYYVTDLSRNGTFSEGGLRLQPHTETALMKGEKIFLGNKKDVFRLG